MFANTVRIIFCGPWLGVIPICTKKNIIVSNTHTHTHTLPHAHTHTKTVTPTHTHKHIHFTKISKIYLTSFPFSFSLYVKARAHIHTLTHTGTQTTTGSLNIEAKTMSDIDACQHTRYHSWPTIFNDMTELMKAKRDPLQKSPDVQREKQISIFKGFHCGN